LIGFKRSTRILSLTSDLAVLSYIYMNQMTTTTIKDGTVLLPERLRQTWRNAPVYITGEKDTIVIKRLRAPQFLQMLDAMNDAGKDIPPAVLDEALVSARARG